MLRPLTFALAATLIASAPAQSPATATHPARPVFPTRDAHTTGYFTATDLPDDTVPSPTADGNFIIGPTHTASPDAVAQPSIPHGTIADFTLTSKHLLRDFDVRRRRGTHTVVGIGADGSML